MATPAPPATPPPASAPGRFGQFGGRYVSETLIPSLDELTAAWAAASADSAYTEELSRLLTDYVGRPTPLGFAGRLSAEVAKETGKDVRIHLKREDLCHTGAHKINNCIGQVLLARRMGKTRIIAETGAGQHGVATATACALFGLPCEVYMGAVDVERQGLNVFRMKLLGAKVHSVKEGTSTLKDAMNEALRDWVTNVRTTHYVIGSAAGPHPYPTLVRELQAVIGREARMQIQEAEGRLPDALVACVGGGSNAIGLFHAFVPDTRVALFGVEAAGDGIDTAPSRGDAGARAAGRAARRALVRAVRSRGADLGGAFDLGGPRLPRRRARTRLHEGDGPREVPVGHRHRGAGGVPAPGAHGRDPVRAGERARDRRAAQGRGDAARRRASSSSTSPGGATRTWARSPSRLGVTL